MKRASLLLLSLTSATFLLPGNTQIAFAKPQSGTPGADDAKEQVLQTALVRAAYDGDVAAIQTALSQGALLNGVSRQISQMTALGAATRQGQFASAKRLLDVGADPEAKDDYGQTPLYRAASVGNTSLVDHFLKRGVNPNPLDVYTKTPLLMAAAGGYDDTVRLLLQHGARPGFGKLSGGDPLMWAARKGHITCMRLLLAAGASEDSKNGALAWAYSMGQPPEVLRVLKQAGAVPRGIWLPYDREPEQQ